ncbi:MAG: hypothetical protein KU38_01610 [Sulfurovum sp. FS08-3]|nr:MAG: hypothetical protein KU38_01610 [Sulfurovum sp. FS08-3]
MKNIKLNYPLLFLLVTLFLAISFLVYHQAYDAQNYFSDTKPHIEYLRKYFSLESFYIPHPLWHYGVKITSELFFISIELAAVIFSAFLVTLWTYLVYHTIKYLSKIESDLCVTLLTFTTIIIAPLTIPWYNQVIYLGQSSPNIWHNVTLWSVKPFALLTMFFMIEAIRSQKRHYYFISLVTLLISILAKPSFVIAFLPAIALFVLMKKLIYREFIVFYLLFTILSVVILSYQYTHTFTGEDSHVFVDFLGVWSQSSLNIPISIVLALAFPIALFILETKIIHDDYILLSWILTFIGIVFYAVFAQSGKYYPHGNFGWSYAIAMSLLYLFSIIKFAEIYKGLHFIKKSILLTLLALQTLIGLYYLIKILEGQSPLYISIGF